MIADVRLRLSYQVVIVALMAMAAGWPLAARAAAGDTHLVSVNKAGTGSGGANTSGPPAVSANGRYVLYGHHNNEVLLRDRWERTTELVNVPYAGGEPDNLSYNEALTADGRYATYISTATNLVPGDSNGDYDIFLRDRQTGTTERISVNSNEVEANGGNSGSAISDDGRFVVFMSVATNLAAASANSPPIFIRDRELGTTRRLVPNPPWALSRANARRLSMSADGRYVAFEAVGPAPLDEENVFVHDRATNTTQRISVAAHGGPLASSGGGEWPSISADGRYVAFASTGNDFGPSDTDTDWDIYVRDRQTGVITRESYGYAPWVKGSAYAPSLSADGRFVSFGSSSWNLIAGQPDRHSRGNVYTRDRKTGAIERDSFAYDGTDADNGSYWPALTRNGRWVVFLSLASDLVPNDRNAVRDVFIHDRGLAAP